MNKKESAPISKYVEIGTMSFPDFASSSIGTVAKFFLSKEKKSLFNAGKSIKACCAKVGSACTIKSTPILIKVDDDTWVQSHVLEAEITVERSSK